MNTVALVMALVLCTLPQPASAQPPTTLSLDACVERARAHYPLVAQQDLVRRSAEYSVDNAYRGYLPQVSVTGHASYQSAVTEVPVRIPGFAPEPLSLDQYRVQAEVTQTIWDGGVMAGQAATATAQSDAAARQVDVELYRLRDRVQQLYFGVMLLREQAEQVRLKIADLDAVILSVKGAVQNGAALRSSLNTLEAEHLTAQQRLRTLLANERAYRKMLGMLIGTPVDTSTVLSLPADRALRDTVRRPELDLFGAQERAVQAREEVIGARSLPRFTAFFTGGYGRPGLDMLKNDFSPYFITGVRLQWALTDLYASSAERELLAIERSTIDVQRRTFLFNTELTLEQERSEAEMYADLVRLDDAIIERRAAVLASSRVQLTEGIRMAHDYVRDLNNLDMARRERSLHVIHRAMAIASHASTSGN